MDHTTCPEGRPAPGCDGAPARSRHGHTRPLRAPVRRWTVRTTGPTGHTRTHHAPTLDAAMVRAAIILGRRATDGETPADAVIREYPAGAGRRTGSRRAVRVRSPGQG